jgi:hypothetical protein
MHRKKDCEQKVYDRTGRNFLICGNENLSSSFLSKNLTPHTHTHHTHTHTTHTTHTHTPPTHTNTHTHTSIILLFLQSFACVLFDRLVLCQQFCNFIFYRQNRKTVQSLPWHGGSKFVSYS